MKTEEDTFRILKRKSFDELEQLLRQHHSIVFNLSDFLKQHGWTKSEWVSAWNRSIR